MGKFIAITPGEPAGIGPDIVLKAAKSLLACKSTPVVFASLELLKTRAKQLDINLNIADFYKQQNPHDTNHLLCINVPLIAPCIAGTENSANAKYVLYCLKQAADLCLNNKFSALVTGPINKAIINDSGVAFSGHTEFLAEMDKSTPVMMLATEKMRVALATTHLPLANVSQAITKASLKEIITILNRELLNTFKITQPKILVLGLNPHAGENGHLGKEEIETIIPALESLRKQGINISGPLPADTAFSKQNLSEHDAILAMYHDQGLPVLKYSGFGEAVNITLGLSFIRTSVDHGTALDLAGTGKASHSSLLAAYKTAEDMVYA